MLKARLWLKDGSAYPTRGTSDKRLNEIVVMLDRCSRNADNGTWGCVGCREFNRCWRLFCNMVNRSVLRTLRVSDTAHFKAKFAVIGETLEDRN